MLRFLKNGQWTLEALHKSSNLPSIHNLMHDSGGNPIHHTVEVHPDMDHFYNVKGLIQKSGKPHLQIGDIKKTGEFQHIIDRVPRDARGRVTPELIDQHIAKLPKQKVEIKVVPYEDGFQQHREGNRQYVASVGLHSDTYRNLNPAHKYFWDAIKNKQHNLGGHPHQIGWARIDPHREEVVNLNDEEEAGIYQKTVPNEGHWHLDEIQSDFGTPEKLHRSLNGHTDHDDIQDEIETGAVEIPKDVQSIYHQISNLEDARDQAHARGEDKDPHTNQISQAYQALNDIITEVSKEIAQERRNKLKELGLSDSGGRKTQQQLMRILSHGHDDPQHLIHSAVNQLARQNGITSTSMDTPHDQAHQSGLQPKPRDTSKDDWWDKFTEARWGNPLSQEESGKLWEKHGKKLADRHMTDMHFNSAAKKLGPEGVKNWAHLLTQDSSSWLYDPVFENDDEQIQNAKGATEETKRQLVSMTPDELHALGRYMNDYDEHLTPYFARKLNLGPVPKRSFEAEYDLPVHQINTYDKRPKKLGMTETPKKDVMGYDPSDKYQFVQYGKLHKKLQRLNDLLKKFDD